jgi:hypothetical protein
MALEGFSVELAWNHLRQHVDRSRVREHADHGAGESTRIGSRTVRSLTRAAPVHVLTRVVP